MKPLSKKRQWRMKSPVGLLYLEASGDGLNGIFFKKQASSMALSLKGRDPVVKILSKSVGELRAYFAGRLKKFSIPLDPAGSVFQKKVWKELERIPYGCTSSYRDIAARIRNKKAFRAVGSANGKNPLCIIIPCHRVIAADGSIGGYSGGLSRKRKLLMLEGIKRF